MKKLLLSANILMIIFFLLRFSSLPLQIPLFYSKPWGEDQLADSWLIFILPLMMDIFFYLNLYFYKKFFSENPFVKKIIDYLNLFLIISLTLIFIKIIFLVT
jgi:hypothetical protein